MEEAKKNIGRFEEGIVKLNSLPPDFAKLNDELVAKKADLEELMNKAATLIEKLSNGECQNDELQKVKTNTEANTTRLDKIQKEEKMMNLLLSNLPPVLQNIQGFVQFAYNELNVEINPGDIMFLNKVFESTNRVVHLVRFRNLEIRNTVFRGRINLGFRSRIWINEDLIPTKESLALGARSRYRVGKIAKNWTFQGEVYITMKDDPTPRKITKEEDFPPETKLEEGEGMLPKELPIRRMGGQSYINRQVRPQYNPVPQRQTQQQMSTGNQQIPPQQQIPNVQVQSHPNQYPMITQTPAQDINAFQ